MAASVAMAAISTPKTSTAWHPAPGGTWWHLVAGGDLRDASDVGCRMLGPYIFDKPSQGRPPSVGTVGYCHECVTECSSGSNF